MQNLNIALLILHVTAGYIALTSGAVVMAMKKGTRIHRKLGRLFYYSMWILGLCAIYLAWAKTNSFLLHIGIFVLYQNYAGNNSVVNRSLMPNGLGIFILIAASVNSGFMLASKQIVLMVFGGISLLLVFNDLRLYYALFQKKEIRNLAWLARHIGMMLGSYIGAFTAFLVVNVQNVKPAWLIWLAPTFVIVPLMQFWTWKFTKKSNSRYLNN